LFDLAWFGFRIKFAGGLLANKEDWNKVIMAAKMVSDSNIQVSYLFLKG
jgi:hypothetical protein